MGVKSIKDASPLQGSQLSEGDHIVAINGATGDVKALLKTIQETKEGEALNVVVKRPADHTVRVIRKAKESIGLDLGRPEKTEDGDFLFVKGMKAGACKVWSDQNTEITPYSRIISVNGVKGNADTLLKELKKDTDKDSDM